MSHIGISLSANTASYVKRIKDARTETDRNIIKMEQRIDQFAQDVNKNFTSVGGSIDAMLGGLRNIKGGGYVAAIAGLGVASVAVASQIKQMATQTIEAQKQIKIAAERSKVSTEEIQRWGMVTATVGLDLEKFSDINKDVFDKLGEYITTGGGAFVDFFDVVKGKSSITAHELQKLSGPDVLMKVVEEMENAGASGSQMTWVLESLGNDASNLLPLLKDNAAGFKELKSRMDELGTVPDVLKEATIEVQYMDAAFSKMWSNFGVLMTNQFEDLFGLVGRATTAINNMFAGTNAQSLVDRQISKYKNQEFVIGVNDSNEDLAIKEAALEKMVSDAVRNKTNASISELKNKIGMHNIKGKNPFMSVDDERAHGEELVELMTQLDDEVEKLKAEERKQYKDFYAKINEVRTLNGYKDGGASETEEVDKRFKVEKSENESAHLKQKELLTNKLVAAKKNLSIETEVLNRMEADAAAAAAANPDDDKLNKEWEFKLKSQRKVVKEQQEIVETGNDAIAKADKDFYDGQAKAAKDAAKEKQEIEDRAFEARLDAAQREIDAAQTTAEKLKAIENKKLLEIEQMQKRYQANLQQRIKDGSISEIRAKEESAQAEIIFAAQKEALRKETSKQEAAAKHSEEVEKLNVRRQFATTEIEERKISHDLQLKELQRQKDLELVSQADFENKKAQLQRDFEENERTLKMANFLDSETVEMMNAQLAMERLKEQYANQLITEEEFEKQRIEIERRVTEAKRVFAAAQLDTLAGTFGQMASMSEEGSSRQKAALVAQQAATLASMTMNQWQAWSDVDKDPLLITGTQKMIAKANILAQYSAGLANVGAALGQFHSGTDEVDQTGSYILQSGERVVQRAANKDLTNFLESNQSGSGAVTIDAPLVIEGDVNVDENRLNAWAVSHRDHLAKVFKLAQRENPSLR